MVDVILRTIFFQGSIQLGVGFSLFGVTIPLLLGVDALGFSLSSSLRSFAYGPVFLRLFAISFVLVYQYISLLEPPPCHIKRKNQ